MGLGQDPAVPRLLSEKEVRKQGAPLWTLWLNGLISLTALSDPVLCAVNTQVHLVKPLSYLPLNFVYNVLLSIRIIRFMLLFLSYGWSTSLHSWQGLEELDGNLLIVRVLVRLKNAWENFLCEHFTRWSGTSVLSRLNFLAWTTVCGVLSNGKLKGWRIMSASRQQMTTGLQDQGSGRKASVCIQNCIQNMLL